LSRGRSGVPTRLGGTGGRAALGAGATSCTARTYQPGHEPPPGGGQNGAVTTYDRPFGRAYEEFDVGDVYRHWPGKTITEADDHLFCMVTMNHHPLHTNAWFAEHETVHGRNVVVGNLVYSLALGMSVPDVSGSCIANLEVESLRHQHPTFHGDTIYAETRVLEKVPSSSKPDRGIVTVETKAFNQDGKEVCYFRRKVMVWTTDALPPRRRPYGDDVWG
jgi:acyl dehydratase